MLEALNNVFKKGRKKNKDQDFVAWSRIHEHDLGRNLVVELDAKNQPLSLDEIEALNQKGKQSKRKVVVYMLTRRGCLTTTDGKYDTLKPKMRQEIAACEKLGYEVITINPDDTYALHSSPEFCAWIAGQLGQKIRKRL